MQGRGVKQGWWLIQERRVYGLQRFGRNKTKVQGLGIYPVFI
jgi:hypothetical protein